jgi:phenylalanyl-tRNA synthetase alpha subunit
MAGFLDEIEPLKQTARAELKAAPDLAALEQSKGAWIGPNGKFTTLMKQLGTLSKEEKPAAGKLINAAKVELEAALLERRSELRAGRRAAQTSHGFHSARSAPRAGQTASAHASHRRHRPRLPQDWLRRGRWTGDRR